MSRSGAGSFRHEKIEVAQSVFGRDCYADFFKENGPHPRLIVYFGGATGPAIYAERRKTVPEAVLGEFIVGHGEEAGLADLLVVPAPQALYSPVRRRQLAGDVHDHVLSELLPRVGGTYREIHAVGYSYGAMLALGFGLLRQQGIRISMVGGVGMEEMLGTFAGTPVGHLGLACFVNSEEVVHVLPNIFSAARAAAGLNVTIYQAPGGHPFEDYAASGLMRRAFEFALGRSDGWRIVSAKEGMECT